MRRYAVLVVLMCMPLVSPAQGDGFVVDRATQAKRDDSRRAILEEELRAEQLLLREAEQRAAGVQAARAPEPAIRDAQEAVRRHRANIEALKRELTNARGAIVRVAESAADPRNAIAQELPGAKPSVTLRNPGREALRGRGNPRLAVFPYDRNNTYPIYLMDALNTHIEFPEGEHVRTLSVSNCGQDSPFWTCSISEDRRHIWIKPKAPDLINVGTIVTNRRVYEISLHAVGPGRDWYQRVTWDGGWQDQGFFEFRDTAAPGKTPATSPNAEAKPSHPPGNVDKLQFTYAIEGNAPFRPQMVFDDGRFTWIKLGSNVQELPALFVLAGDEVELVNYTQRGEYLLVNRLVPGLLLKLGKAEVRIRNQGYGAGR